MLKYKFVKNVDIFDDIIRNTTVEQLVKICNNHGIKKEHLIRIILNEASKKLDRMIKEV